MSAFLLDLPQGEPGIVSARLLQRPGLVHAFTTRHGGLAGDLELGPPLASEGESLTRDCARLVRRLGCDGARLYRLRQVHSARVAVVEAGETPAAVGRQQADALVTAERGVTLAVQTADCVPVLLADVEGRAVAADHAGWRGLVGGVLERTIAVLRERFGCRGASLRAVIGPCVGVECYEVSTEVAGRFAGLPGVVSSDLGARPHINLALAARRILAAEGLAGPAVATVELCTVCRGDLFYSYRRDGVGAGRQLSLIGFAK